MTAGSVDAAEVGHSPAPLFRMTCALAGVDPALIAACPPRDGDGVRLLAALMILVWLWQSTVFAAVAHLMLAGPGEVRAELIAGAVLLATIILLLDAYVVMRPSWTTFGYEELRRGGLAIHLPVLARVKGGAFLALRLALSGVIGTLVALFVSLVLYGKDIAGQLAAEHAARNVPVIAAATRLVDDRIARNVSAEADLRARIAAADRTADGLRRGIAERADPAIAAATAALARAERDRERAEADATRLARRADAPSLARARRRLEATTAERDAAHVLLAEMEKRAISLTQGRDTTLAGQLFALDAQRRQDLERLAAAEAEQGTMLNGRAATVQAAVAADPAYAAPDDGLLARLRALKALTADQWVGAVVLLLEVFFAGIELAAVFSKLLSFVPATYATRLAREDQLRQIATAREIDAALEVPAEQAAGTAVSERIDVPPGTLAAAGVTVSAGADGWPSGSPMASKPDRAVSPPTDTDPDQNPQASVSSPATPEASEETSTFPSASVDEPPVRRKRGRPQKARPDLSQSGRLRSA